MPLSLEGKNELAKQFRLASTNESPADAHYQARVDQVKTEGFLNEQAPSTGRTALHFALVKGQFEKAQILFDAGAETHVLDKQDKSALSAALVLPNEYKELKENILKRSLAHALAANMAKLNKSRTEKHLVYWSDLLDSIPQQSINSDQAFTVVTRLRKSFSSHPDFTGYGKSTQKVHEEECLDQHYVIKPGKSPASALESLLKHEITTISCATAVYIVYFLTLLDLLCEACGKEKGTERFNILFSGSRLNFGPLHFHHAIDLQNAPTDPISPLLFFLEESEPADFAPLNQLSTNPSQIGQRILFLNKSTYVQKHPIGNESGISLIAVGPEQYVGFGFEGIQTTAGVSKFLQEAFDRIPLAQQYPQYHKAFETISKWLRSDSFIPCTTPEEVKQVAVFEGLHLARLTRLLGDDKTFSLLNKEFDIVEGCTKRYQTIIAELLSTMENALAEENKEGKTEEGQKELHRTLIKKTLELVHSVKKQNHLKLSMLLTTGLLRTFYRNETLLYQSEHLNLLNHWVTGYRNLCTLLDSAKHRIAREAKQSLEEVIYDYTKAWGNLASGTTGKLTPDVAHQFYQGIIACFKPEDFANSKLPEKIRETLELLDQWRSQPSYASLRLA